MHPASGLGQFTGYSLARSRTMLGIANGTRNSQSTVLMSRTVRSVCPCAPTDLCRIHADAVDCPDVDPRPAYRRRCLDFLRLHTGRSQLVSVAAEIMFRVWPQGRRNEAELGVGRAEARRFREDAHETGEDETPG